MFLFAIRLGQRVLSIAGNCLELLPTTLTFMRYITVLDLSNNRLSGLTDELRACVSLTRINLKRNKFLQVPAVLASLPSLKVCI
jgi:Leucine-rich repeat (LRR) protein